MSRGCLNDRVQEVAVEAMGRPIDVTELRLIPYLHYVMVNEQKLDPNKISPDERKILRKLKEEGHIEGGASGLAITKTYWNAMNEILWASYVDRRD